MKIISYLILKKILLGVPKMHIPSKGEREITKFKNLKSRTLTVTLSLYQKIKIFELIVEML